MDKRKLVKYGFIIITSALVSLGSLIEYGMTIYFESVWLCSFEAVIILMFAKELRDL